MNNDFNKDNEIIDIKRHLALIRDAKTISLPKKIEILRKALNSLEKIKDKDSNSKWILNSPK